MTHVEQTIAAVATPPGRGGVGIIRVSGSLVPEIGRAIIGECPPPRVARFARFRGPHGETLDEGLALFFPAPNSFTGEDVLELQGHGGPVVMDMLLGAVLHAGARIAEPGEFSRRAFLNGKMDLAQAEAVADLIEASSSEAARCALRSLQGEFSRRVQALDETLVEIRMYVESAIDFPEEEIDFLAEGDILARLQGGYERLEAITASAGQGRLLREGMSLVIAGPPNVGKSSLLNQLVGQDTAIVTEVPGTTRDVLRERIHIDGMPLHIIDTAGLRISDDQVEQEGIRRARVEMEKADRVIVMIDDSRGLGPDEQELLAQLTCPATLVFNKIDRTGRPPGWFEVDGLPALALSARTGAGLAELRQHLKDAMGYRGEGAGDFMARRRHLDALERTSRHLRYAMDLVASGAAELVAEELRLAHTALGEITGETTADELLGRIFASFCIGK